MNFCLLIFGQRLPWNIVYSCSVWGIHLPDSDIPSRNNPLHFWFGAEGYFYVYLDCIKQNIKKIIFYLEDKRNAILYMHK